MKLAREISLLFLAKLKLETTKALIIKRIL